MTMAKRFERDIPNPDNRYMGDPDGPMRFVPSLGMEVPTFIDPRDDLKSQYRTAKAHKSVDYHIPPDKRGTYVPADLADFDGGKTYSLTTKMKARCGGLDKAGRVCQKAAVNRTGFCTNHGGALHPADKFYFANRGIAPTNVENLSRLDKVMVGVIPVSELSDEEISRQKIRDDNGLWVEPNPKIAPKLYREMNAEFFKRANDYIRANTLDMLKVMVQIAESTANEPADRQKAAQWMVERSLGKTPDVLLTNKSDKPFEQMFTDITSGSREEYRNSIRDEYNEFARGELSNPNVIEGEVVVISDENEDEDEDEQPTNESPIRPPGTDGTRTSGTELGVDESGDGTQEAATGRLVQPSDSDNADPMSVQADLSDSAREKQEARERIIKARKRRYAARSQGRQSIENLAFDLKFSRIETKDGEETRMKIVMPEDVKLPRTR